MALREYNVSYPTEKLESVSIAALGQVLDLLLFLWRQGVDLSPKPLHKPLLLLLKNSGERLVI